MIGLPTRYIVYINDISEKNSIMITDDFDDTDAKDIFNSYKCDKIIVTEDGEIVKEISKKEFEVYLIDKLCNKIHQEFKNSSSRNYNVLENICQKNDITVHDYLYNQGYHDYFEYKEDIKILPIKELSINEILNKIPKTIKEYLDCPINLIKKENTSCDSQNDLIYADNEICYYDCHDGDYVYIDTQEAMAFKEETNHSYLKNKVLYVNDLSENLIQVDNNKSLYNEICIKYNLYDCIKENCYIDENFKKDIEGIRKITDYKILSNCVDYQILKENLSEEELKQLEKGLESFQYYQSIYDDGDIDIIGEYESKYGNVDLIDWYEGLIDTDEFIKTINCDIKNEI